MLFIKYLNNVSSNLFQNIVVKFGKQESQKFKVITLGVNVLPLGFVF
jgi:hypothetical protein